MRSCNEFVVLYRHESDSDYFAVITNVFSSTRPVNVSEFDHFFLQKQLYLVDNIRDLEFVICFL